MNLTATKLAGSGSSEGRVPYDYYATNPKAVYDLYYKHHFTGTKVLEPCVGGGHIARVVKRLLPESEITALDIVDRGYPGTIVTDFLEWETDETFDLIITNPPFSYAQEFVQKGMSLLAENGQMMMFLKIQFLESERRRELFNIFPPKYIYVFSSRMGTWRNGEELDPKTGKQRVTTMCHAWFIWEQGFRGEPVVRWI